MKAKKNKTEVTKKKISDFAPSILIFVFFLIYTVLVKFTGVAAIGPKGSVVGFAGLNGAFENNFGFNEAFYKLSEYFGYAALGVAACFAFMGLYQLITRKKLKKVDREILLLGNLYVAVIVFYALFEFVIINYRPVILEEELEASYPSSHTMLAVTVLVSALMTVGNYIKNEKLLIAVRCFLIVLCGAIVIFRFLSGVHWVTDIVGGLILSAALCLWFDEMH